MGKWLVSATLSFRKRPNPGGMPAAAEGREGAGGRVRSGSQTEFGGRREPTARRRVWRTPGAGGRPARPLLGHPALGGLSRDLAVGGSR